MTYIVLTLSVTREKTILPPRHGTKFWKILKSQNFGCIDIDFDIENYNFKILILILILKFASPKYWFWYWYWTFWEFWYWYWYWYWKKKRNILIIWVVRKTQVPLWPWGFRYIFHCFMFSDSKNISKRGRDFTAWALSFRYTLRVCSMYLLLEPTHPPCTAEYYSWQPTHPSKGCT